ncbi:MAG TPA: kelch repeat-containing protein, partial [Pirellulales bacterium]
AQAPRWQTTSLVLDLRAKQLAWKKLPKQPFERRALAAAAIDGKLYAIGGLQSQGGISKQVDVFDIESQSWSKGPDIPGMPMNGNGIAACTSEGRVDISGLDGNVYRLDKNGANWDVAGRLNTPRFHHKLLAWRPGTLLAVAGATRMGKLVSIDAVALPASSPQR